MRLFQSKSKPSAEPTFKAKTESFWAWWSAESNRILAGLDQDGGAGIQPEISAAVNELCPGFAWVFGPGSGEGGHSFTISPEGNGNLRFLASHAVARAPDLDRWTFHASRQPSTNLDDMEIRIGDSGVATKSLWITPEIDQEHELIDITAWSPSMAGIGEDHAQTILFLLLDEALGENGVETWLGSVELGNGKLEHSFPLTELPEFVATTAKKNGWEKPPLEETYSSYQLPEPLGDFPRGDTVAGTTRAMTIVRDYLDNEGPVDDPIAGSGAAFIFLQMPRSLFPGGQELDRRGEIEDALHNALTQARSGLCLGGATGRDAAYIELLIFDGDRSLELIHSAMKAQGLPGQYQVQSFTR